MKGDGREIELESGGVGGGWTEGRAFINIHVLILNILNILCNFPSI